MKGCFRHASSYIQTQTKLQFKIAFSRVYAYSKPMKTARLKLPAYIDQLKRFYRQADEVLKTHPMDDRQTLIQTLFALQKKPADRLKQALLRARIPSHVIR